MRTSTRPPVITSASLANSDWYLGNRLSYLATPEQTDARFTLVEALVRDDGVPPPHVHTREDELYYLIDGEATFLAGSQEITGGPGTFIFFPKGVPHAFQVRTSTAKFIYIAT